MADKIVTEALKRWDEGKLAERHNIKAAEEDLEFLIEQWEPEVRREREREGRPCLSVPRLHTFVRQVANEVRLQPPSIQVRPVEDGDIETADVIEGLVRHIEEASDARAKYAQATEDAVRCSQGFLQVRTQYSGADGFDQDIVIEAIVNPLSVIFDPNAVEPTRRDAKWCIVYEDMTKEAFKAAHPKASETSFEGLGTDQVEWFGDNTIRRAVYWVVEEEDVRLVEFTDGTIGEDPSAQVIAGAEADGIFVKRERKAKKKKVRSYLISGAEVLDGPFDWPGDRIPIIPVWGEEVRMGAKRVRMSLIRPAKDAQRMLNYWRSATVERIALAPKAPWLVTPANIEGYEDMWSQAAVGNPAVLVAKPDPITGMPQRIAPAPMEAAMLQEAALANDELKAVTGIFDAALGAKSNETSGKAIMARQQEADVGTYAFIDNALRAVREVGRIVVALIPSIYDTARQVRIIGKKDEPKVVKVNQQFLETVTDPETGQKYQRPRTYDLTAGKYDVSIQTGPSFTTRRQGIAQAYTEIMSQVPQIAPILLPRLAQLLDVPDADELAQELKTMLQPPAPQGPPPINPKDQAQADLNAAKADGQKIENVARMAALHINGGVPGPSVPPQEAQPPGALMGA